MFWLGRLPAKMTQRVLVKGWVDDTLSIVQGTGQQVDDVLKYCSRVGSGKEQEIWKEVRNW